MLHGPHGAKVLAVLVVAGCSIIGTAVWQASHAATPAVSLEAEQGTLSGGASQVSDSGASGGSAVAFGSGAVTPPPSPPSGGAFVHPGILVSRGQLDFVKAKIAAGAQPWTSAFNTAKNSSDASLSVVPGAVADSGCGPNENPDYGCKAEHFNSVSAYTDALIWYYSGNQAYANKAIQILNAWSSTLQTHSGDNAPLHTAWTAIMFTRAAEILRYSNSGWSAADAQKWGNLLTNVYLRDMTTSYANSVYSSYNGNWATASIEAKMEIAVYNNDRTLYNNELQDWKARTEGYVYLKTDNGGSGVPMPIGSHTTASNLYSFWGINSSIHMPDGQAQETCRDMQHTGMGLSSIYNAAETAYIQGTDLYTQEQARLVAGLEDAGKIIASGYGSGTCATSPPAPTTAYTYTIGYNEYAGRKGLSLPYTKKIVDNFAAKGGSGTGRMFAWETLTHYGTESAHIGN